MTETAPDWLLTMRAMSGNVVEEPGSGNNPKIMGMADEIGRTWGDMKAYCNGYRADSIPWCGLAVAYCVSKANIRPPFGDSDTERFLWARSWADDPGYTKIKTPRLGCITVLTRSGGGHISLYEADAGTSVKLRGGNQSDAVNVSGYPKANVIGYYWPRDAQIPEPITPPISVLPVLRKGSTGASVVLLQTLLPKWVDGDFGSVTDALVREFQRSEGLEVDGVVGSATWAALMDEAPPPPVPAPVPDGWIDNITATVFGAFEGEQSAYGGKLDDTKPFVALPDRFEGERPKVQVRNMAPRLGDKVGGETATIEDVGPWMIDDDYWSKGKRPIAEQCYATKTPIPSGPQKGRVPSNPAGIDLSPSLARDLGIEGMGKVSWRFMSS